MSIKKLLGMVLAALLTGSLVAADVALNPNHPDRYVVVKGDTLWDISAMFLRDPWLWPEVWYVNPQVSNPHLIYPGDIVYLVFIDGKPQLNPTIDQMKTSDLDLVVAGTANAIMMVESEVKELTEEQMLQALSLAHKGMQHRRLSDAVADIYAQIAGNEAIVSMVSLGFGVGIVPRIVLDNSPLADQVRVLDVRPGLDPYEVGLFALDKRLASPLISAFWSGTAGEPR